MVVRPPVTGPRGDSTMMIVWILLAQFLWLHMYTGDIVNVALHKTAKMSSIHDRRSNRFSVENGVDGNTSSIIHTRADRPSAWWTVDLGTKVQDALVTIYFRLSNQYRRNGVQIYTSMTPFSSYPGGQSCRNITSRTDGKDIPNNVNVTCSGTWRHLMVYSGTTNDAQHDKGPVLDFGEVTVLECQDDVYGANCTKSCSSRNCVEESTSCNRFNGSCSAEGCKAGWHGTDCTKECLPQMYGANCVKNCGSRHCVVSSTTCNNVTGVCPRGCRAGWKGTDCLEECLPEMYGENCIKNCSSRHCVVSSRTCDHVTGVCPRECQAVLKGTGCLEGETVNVALNKPVSMSSRHDQVRFPPEMAVDGNTTARPPSIIHTNAHKTPTWWWVNLQTLVQDATVKIYFRTDERKRRNGTQFYTSFTPFSSNLYPQGQLCHNIIGTNIEDVVSVNCPGTWQYLMVYTNTINVDTDKNPVLDFGEVQVRGCNGSYGQNCGGCQGGWMGTDCMQVCSSGMYGANCNNSCDSRHCTSQSTTCSRSTGACPGGCQPGWRGKDCMEDCSPTGKYGANCAKSCVSRHCITPSAQCDKVTGICPEGCQAGWMGTDCLEECANGTYGQNCNMSCGARQCAGTSSCDPQDGTCTEGCKAGWMGTDCTQECSNGKYGINCDNSCTSRHCVASSTSCDRQTGTCPGGCQPGWMGTDCTEECPLGKYGMNCTSDCISRHCTENTSTCNRTTGECPLTDGCMPGWRGIDCSQACVGDTYGQDCNISCGHRKCQSASSSCDHVTGHCDEGCRPGWDGTDCIHECPTTTYGDNCSKHCDDRHCLTSSNTCDHVTGACTPEGCKSRWQGTDCVQKCGADTFGTNCSPCSTRHCKSMTECPDDGVCIEGCEDGWTLDNCTQACPNGTYGPDCSSTCGKCAGDTICHHSTGVCTGDCQAGWIGGKCKQPHKDPAVAGGVTGVLVIVVVIAVVAIAIIIYRRKKRTASHENYEETGMISFDASATKKNSNYENNVYVNVEQVQPKIEKVQSRNRQPEVLADSEQEEEVPDEGAASPSQGSNVYVNVASALELEEEVQDEDEPSPSRDYYNESAEVIREVAVADLAATIQKIKQREGGFATEYSRLSPGFTAPYGDSHKPENASKNKDRGLYPYDHNRVRLSTLPGIPGSDYINASLMHSYDQKKTYIAAQATNKKTVGDFWRMIWEQRCGRIIMLTGLMEDMKVKCYQYWPDEDVLETDHHRVMVEDTDARADYTVRHLKVTSKTNGEERKVIQYHYTSWPDHGVPDTLALVHFIWMIRRTDFLSNGPLLVHCSAGIGRTGTYIAVDSLLDQARNEGKVDVFDYVSTMRGQRKNMIQTKEQYECVFHCLVEMTSFGNTCMDVDNFATSYSSRGMDSVVDRKTIRELTQMMRTRDHRDTPGRHRMWVDGNQKFIVRVGPTLKHLKGYLLTVASPTGLEMLLWKLVEENDVYNVIIVSPIQVDLVGEKGRSKKYGEITVTTIGQTNLTSDLALVTLQLKATNAERSKTMKLFKCAGSNTVEGMSQHLLDHAHFQHLSDEMSPVVLIHSEPNCKGVVYLCIMGNILAGIINDRCVDVISHVRTFLKCCPDVTLSEEDVEKLHEFSQKCIEMTESSNTYANL